MSKLSNFTDANSVSEEMLRTIARSTILCHQAQRHYQQATSMNRSFYCVQFSTLDDERDQALNDALREAQRGTVKLQTSFSLIHQNLRLCERFPVLTSQADSFPVRELERLKSAIIMPSHSNDYKISLYTNLMNFVRKCEKISVCQQSLLAAVEIHIQCDTICVAFSEEGTVRETDQFPATSNKRKRSRDLPANPMEETETEFQPMASSPPNNPPAYNEQEYAGNFTTRRETLASDYGGAARGRPDDVRREEEYEPLPYRARNDAEDLHYALLVPEVDSSVTIDSVPQRDERHIGYNRAGNDGSTDSTIQSDMRATTPSTMHQEPLGESYFSACNSNENSRRPDIPRPPVQRQDQPYYNESALALALGGRDDFVRRDFHNPPSSTLGLQQ
eukprot:CAMPEP_0172377628 /NCGR_PEP_ID=MMETSP1060-20121228/69006_1 /TAXON_ID=37318 /ORGANISM="Pseudo-nitzschia pungens, Strain cf. cingulata" /LENGTH=389 /DNA_ID=CAMNT_0013105329 /DNA_START=301 /DNA_END=1470 /DNA_ORIENTATION=+